MPQIILGIESSCDETAASIVRYDGNQAVVLSSIIASQIKDHAPYGGVVPEIAARKHVENIDDVIKLAMAEAGVNFKDLTGIAATSGPGLIGGVMVGLLSAKALAIGTGLPFIGVNHLEGHALSPQLSANLPFPYLLLLVSGGHCQILKIEKLGEYKRLGTSIDDALGEAFDKVAKTLGLGYPGGPLVEKAAANGDANKYDLPRPMIGRAGCDFSFAGLKTAVVRLRDNILAQNEKLSQQDINDICATFQKVVIEVLCDRIQNAFELCGLNGDDRRLIVAGGVAANGAIRAELAALCVKNNYSFFAPELRFCGDNGAMIALAGAQRMARGEQSNLNLKPRPRWPLDEVSQPIKLKHGFGKKGAKF